MGQNVPCFTVVVVVCMHFDAVLCCTAVAVVHTSTTPDVQDCEC